MIIQCSIPVFEGLLPENHNKIILDLLFSLALWHGIAKLRMHTEATVNLLDATTRVLGSALRTFRDRTCTAYETRETERETTARCRRTAQQSKSGIADGSQQIKRFNMSTVKMHVLGDYPFFIRWFGSTDSYSTQIVNFSFPHVSYFSLTLVFVGRT